MLGVLHAYRAAREPRLPLEVRWSGVASPLRVHALMTAWLVVICLLWGCAPRVISTARMAEAGRVTDLTTGACCTGRKARGPLG